MFNSNLTHFLKWSQLYKSVLGLLMQCWNLAAVILSVAYNTFYNAKVM